MAEPVWLQGVVTIFVGALSGGITNAVAVWMLFHPYEPRGVGRFKLQGAIPKNKARLAKSIGKTVGQRLLTEEDLARQLTAPGVREAFDRAIAGFLDNLLNTSRGSLKDELPPALAAELERSLEPLAQGMANRLADFLEGPGFDGALEKYVAIERWVEEGVERPELERAVRAFIATQRDRLLHDEHPLLERLPPGLVAALEQAIADYLPVAVERIGGLLSDPEARARVRNGLKRFLDRAIRSLAMHERVMAKLVITENRIERVLASLEGDGLADVAEVFESAEFRGQVGRAVNDAVVRFLRRPIAERLWALGPDRLDGVEHAAADYIIAALRAPETRRWAVARARDAIALARRALAGEGGRQRLADAAHAAVRALLERPTRRSPPARRGPAATAGAHGAAVAVDAAPGAGRRLATVRPGDGRAESDAVLDGPDGRADPQRDAERADADRAARLRVGSAGWGGRLSGQPLHRATVTAGIARQPVHAAGASTSRAPGWPATRSGSTSELRPGLGRHARRSPATKRSRAAASSHTEYQTSASPPPVAIT